MLSPRLLAWRSPSSPPGGRRSRWPTATARSVPASCRGPAGFLVFWGSSHCFRLFHSEKPRMLSNLPEATHGARDPGLWCRGAGGLGATGAQGRGGLGPAQVPHSPSVHRRRGRAGRGSVRLVWASVGRSWAAEPGPPAPRPVPGPVLGAMPQGRGQPSSISISRVRPSPCVHSAREST